ncbi:hypothetical protein NPX13_g6107 [Xylaria arbuscula]|uniref:Uncharacterized protein n=1 Tax=Xylaria arbuscula TaxID=114810 RepID=A0A9W8TKF0_9PEZI|nr:hypothetical protein NPX13_g6107 [Xylaria arbuscula]
MEPNESENVNRPFGVYMSLTQPPLAQQIPSLEQLTGQRQSTPPRQYTTVGSVYHPQSQPLQPPVRRGRTVKSLFPYKSDSPAAPSQLQYTPLQQNSDRAISPMRLDCATVDLTQPSPFGTAYDFQERQDSLAPQVQRDSNPLGAPQTATLGYTDTSRGINNQTAPGIELERQHGAAHNFAMVVNGSNGSDHGTDIADTKPLSAMNFNSLKNLASYPNPNQHDAQKILASHRPNPVPDAQSSDYQLNPYTFEIEQVLPALEPTESYPYGTTLSRVRGAPAPLTAGPPGVRQLRPTASDQENLQRVREFDSENPIRGPDTVDFVYGGYGQLDHTFPVGNEKVPSNFPIEFTDGDQDENEWVGTSNDTDYIVDTLTAEQAKAFYPNGLPRNFNMNAQPTSETWAEERLAEIENSPLHREKKLAERKRVVNNHFYSGVNTFNKSFGEANSEHWDRIVAHTVGRPYQERRPAEGRVENPQLGVREASSIPTSEHCIDESTPGGDKPSGTVTMVHTPQT